MRRVLLRGEANPTSREYEVLVQYVRTGTYKATGAALGISTATVKNHLAHLRLAYGARTTTHLAAMVMTERGDIFQVTDDRDG